jgi:hypothetical protein
VDEAGVFHKLPRLDDSRLAEIFGREVLAFLVGKELLSPEWAERILSWRHTGFSVHSLVRAKTKPEAERVGKYMIRPLLSLERLTLDEREAKVCYRYGKDAEEVERMDYLEFIARVTSHIPDKGQVTVRYYGLYANAHRGKVKKTSLGPLALRMAEDKLRPVLDISLSVDLPFFSMIDRKVESRMPNRPAQHKMKFLSYYHTQICWCAMLLKRFLNPELVSGEKSVALPVPAYHR